MDGLGGPNGGSFKMIALNIWTILWWNYINLLDHTSLLGDNVSRTSTSLGLRRLIGFHMMYNTPDDEAMALKHVVWGNH